MPMPTTPVAHAVCARRRLLPPDWLLQAARFPLAVLVVPINRLSPAVQVVPAVRVLLPVRVIWAAAVVSAAGLLAAVGPGASALAQQTGGARTVGPGRIVCNASFCELGSGVHVKQRFRINASALPEADIRRLRKCTGVSKPCIVTVKGTQLSDQMKIIADSIEWQD